MSLAHGSILTPTLSLTTARARLFQLAEQLLSGETDRVVLTHREFAEPLMMVRASVVTALEAEVAELRGRAAPAMRPLRGLGHAQMPVEEILGEVRARQAALAAKKRERFTSAHDNAYPAVEAPRRRVAERSPHRG